MKRSPIILKLLPFVFIFLSIGEVCYSQSWMPIGDDEFNQPSVLNTGYYGCTFLAKKKNGLSFFYEGEIADSLVQGVRTFDGTHWINEGGTNEAFFIDSDLESDTNNIDYLFSFNGYAASSYSLKKYQNGTWSPVNISGLTGVATGNPVTDKSYFNFEFGPDNKLYCVFCEGLLDSNISVKKFDGNNWSYVGNHKFTYAEAYKKLAFASDGTAYVSTMYPGFPTITSIFKLTGSNWIRIDTAGTSASSFYYFESLTLYNDTPYVIRKDNGAPGSPISIKKYDGTSWITAYSWPSNIDLSVDAELAFSATGTPYVVYNDFAGNVNGFYVANHTVVKKYNGSSWIDISPPLFSGQLFYDEDLADYDNIERLIYSFGFKGNDLYLQYTTKNYYFVQRYSNGIWEPVGSTPIRPEYATRSSLAISKTGVPYVGMADYSESGEATVSQFVNGQWITVGSPGISPYPVKFTSVDRDTNDVPYLAYSRAKLAGQSFPRKINVQKFNGTSWTSVGPADFSSDNVSNGLMRFNKKTNIPYVSYHNDQSSNDTCYIKRFNGTNWVDVGAPFYNNNTSFYSAEVSALTFDTSGKPWAAFYGHYPQTPNNVVVRKFNGSSWDFIGSFSGIAPDGVFSPDLTIGADNTPYLAYSDRGQGDRLTVKKWTGTAWQDVGQPGFSTGPARKECKIITGPDGNPLVAYTDEFYSYKVCVKRFDGTTWVDVGSPALSSTTASSINMQRKGDSLFLAYCTTGAFARWYYLGTIIQPTVTIAASASTGCQGMPISFTATVTNGGTTPSYQWRVNGVNTGTNNNSYTLANPSNGDFVDCIVTSSNPTNPKDTSNAITLSLEIPAPITISGNVCNGDTISLTAQQTLASIAWKVDNNTILTVARSWLANGLTLTTSGQLNGPADITRNLNGDLYVSDALNHRVMKYPASGGIPQVVAGGNGPGLALNQLHTPAGIYLDSSNNLYIADAGNHRVVKYTPGATTGIVVAGGNGLGSTLNKLNRPSSVYATTSGDVYVADALNDRVVMWHTGNTPVLRAGGNGPGAGLNQLDRPSYVLIDSLGNLFVSDQDNNRVLKYAPGNATGVVVAGGNGPGAAVSQLNKPAGIRVNGNGALFIADKNNNRIVRWNGNIAVAIAGNNGAGATANKLNRPSSIALGITDSLWVSDANNDRVQLFLRGIDNKLVAPVAGVYKATATSVAGCIVTSNSNTVGATGVAPKGTAVAYQGDGMSYTYLSSGCKQIVSIQDNPGGVFPGNTTVSAIKEQSVPSYNGRPYLQRHFEILPQTAGAAIVSLYAIQSEFNAYNTYINTNGLSYPLLPASGSNTTAFANITVTKYNGAPTAGTTGPGGQYNAASKVLIPNSAITTTYLGAGVWKLSFAVSNLRGGYFIHTGTTALKPSETETIATAIAQETLVNVYPNPTNDIIHVEISGALQDGMLSITDVTGKKLLEQKIKTAADIDLGSYAPGIYLLKYTDGEMTKAVKVSKE